MPAMTAEVQIYLRAIEKITEHRYYEVGIAVAVIVRNATVNNARPCSACFLDQTSAFTSSIAR